MFEYAAFALKEAPHEATAEIRESGRRGEPKAREEEGSESKQDMKKKKKIDKLIKQINEKFNKNKE